MAEKKGNSLLETRRKNRVYIKDLIYKMEPVTRTDVAGELGLTLPTITTSVNEMISEGIVEEVPVPEEKLTNITGRRPSAIRFVGSAAYAVGVELGPYETSVVLMNLHGEIVSSSVETAADASYERMIQQVARQVQQVLTQAQSAENRFEWSKLLGVGIGISGYVVPEKGQIRIHRNEDWNQKEIAGDLSELLKLPVVADNNVRMRAVGYDMSLQGQRPDSFAYLYVSRGIACPIMEKDNVLTGYTSGAGEVGHMILVMEQEGKMRERYVEDLAGEKAVLEACWEKLHQGGAPLLAKKVRDEELLEMAAVLEAFEEGDPDVDVILRRSMDYLGIALANIVNLVNPGFVVVDAYMMKNERLREIFREAAKKRFFGVNEDEVHIFFLPFDHEKGAKSAAYEVIRKRFLNV